MSEQALEERVEQALAGLGDSADAVARRLSDEGCRGRRKEGDRCPVYAYLDRQFPGQIYSVDSGEVALLVDDLYEYVAPPAGVSDFISQFDDGYYDELAVGQ